MVTAEHQNHLRNRLNELPKEESNGSTFVRLDAVVTLLEGEVLPTFFAPFTDNSTQLTQALRGANDTNDNLQ